MLFPDVLAAAVLVPGKEKIGLGLLLAAAAPKLNVLTGVLLLAAPPGVVLVLAGSDIPILKPPVLEGSGLDAGVEPAAAPLLPAAAGVLNVPSANGLDGADFGPSAMSGGNLKPPVAAAGASAAASLTAAGVLEPHVIGPSPGDTSAASAAAGPGLIPKLNPSPLAGAGVCPALAVLAV